MTDDWPSAPRRALVFMLPHNSVNPKIRCQDPNRDLSVWIYQRPGIGQVKKLVVTQVVRDEYPAFGDTLRYFAPHLETVIVNPDYSNRCQLNLPSSTLLLINQEEACRDWFENSSQWQSVGIFSNLAGYL